jgi:hypothetical protein
MLPSAQHRNWRREVTLTPRKLAHRVSPLRRPNLPTSLRCDVFGVSALSQPPQMLTKPYEATFGSSPRPLLPLNPYEQRHMATRTPLSRPRPFAATPVSIDWYPWPIGRLEILRIHTNSMKLADDVDYDVDLERVSNAVFSVGIMPNRLYRLPPTRTATLILTLGISSLSVTR